MHIDGHIFFLQARKFKGHVDVIRVLVVMHVHPVCATVRQSSYVVVGLCYLLWSDAVSVLEREQGSRAESFIKEAVKGTSAAASIVEEVMAERHLVDDVVK